MTRLALRFGFALFLLAHKAHAGYLLNGSFESPGPGGPAVWIEDAGIASWTAGGSARSATYTRSGDYGIGAQDGVLYIVFGHNRTNGATLSQSFTSTVGSSYLVDYFVTSQQGIDPNQRVTVQAFDGGTLLGSVTMDITATEGKWMAGTPLSFVAGASGTTRISFVDVTPNGQGELANWGLDNVSVTLAPSTSVPEPSSLTSLCIAGLVGLATRRSVRRRSA